MKVITKNPTYGKKDAEKARPCNKFIGRGSKDSSTQFYADNLPTEIVNCSNYTDKDIVFISVEGNRTNRISFDKDELLLAMNAGATIVTDNRYNRTRPYNVGEREVAQFLTDNGFVDSDWPEGAVWKREEKTVCNCGKGYGSKYDGLCRYCRKALVPNYKLRQHNLKRSDGLTITQMKQLDPNY